MLKTKFMLNGSQVSVLKLNEDTVLDHLPAKVYTLQFNQFTGFYLTITKELLQLPEKIYGVTPNRVDKCISTYNERVTSTGILLTGDKGTGKTLLMSLLANKVIKDLELPVVLIKEPYEGEQFTSFIESLGECCLVFDEFGKMYSSSKHDDNVHQDSLLSLMDGVDKTKRLIIMTENGEHNISEFMLNRPSRIYYHFRYSKLDEESIDGYCCDLGVEQSFIRDVIDLSRRSKIFSFDMMQSIIEEYLRFGEDLDTIIQDLNIDVTEEFGAEIEIVKIIRRSDEVQRVIIGSSTITKPGRYNSYIDVESTKKSKDSDEDDCEEIYFCNNHLKYESAGQMVYETDSHTIIAKEIPPKQTDYRHLLL